MIRHNALKYLKTFLIVVVLAISTIILLTMALDGSVARSAIGPKDVRFSPPENSEIDRDVKIVAAWAHSNSGASYLANIGGQGYVFSGTLTARSATYAWDTIIDVYTDKSRKLWVNVEASDTSARAERLSDVSYKLVNSSGVILGTIAFDAKTGDLTIDGKDAGWFQGTLMGMYSRHY